MVKRSSADIHAFLGIMGGEASNEHGGQRHSFVDASSLPFHRFLGASSFCGS